MENDYIEIGGRLFYLDTLSVGQTDELAKAFDLKVKELVTPKFQNIVSEGVDSMCTFFGIILREKDVPLMVIDANGDMKVRNYVQLATFFKYNLDDKKAKELADFFLRNGKRIWTESKGVSQSAKIHQLNTKKK